MSTVQNNCTVESNESVSSMRILFTFSLTSAFFRQEMEAPIETEHFVGSFDRCCDNINRSRLISASCGKKLDHGVASFSSRIQRTKTHCSRELVTLTVNTRCTNNYGRSFVDVRCYRDNCTVASTIPNKIHIFQSPDSGYRPHHRFDNDATYRSTRLSLSKLTNLIFPLDLHRKK